MANMAGVDQLTPMDDNFWKNRFQAVLDDIVYGVQHDKYEEEDDCDYNDDDDYSDNDRRIQADANAWAHLHGYDDQLDAPVWNGDDDDDDGYDSEDLYFWS